MNNIYLFWYMIVLVNPGGEEPCLLVLDSMGGSNTVAMTIIKKFLISLRWSRNHEQTTHIWMICPSTPKQNNGFDSGIFVLHYAEKILCSAKQFATVAPCISNLDNWFSISETNNNIIMTLTR